MTRLDKIDFYNEGALFNGLTDHQIKRGRYIRRMFKALTKGLKMNKNDAINKIIIDIRDNSYMGFDNEINERYIRAILE